MRSSDQNTLLALLQKWHFTIMKTCYPMLSFLRTAHCHLYSKAFILCDIRLINQKQTDWSSIRSRGKAELIKGWRWVESQSQRHNWVAICRSQFWIIFMNSFFSQGKIYFILFVGSWRMFYSHSILLPHTRNNIKNTNYKTSLLGI